MKTPEQIAKTANLMILKNDESGGIGVVEFGKFKGNVIWGRAEGGEYDHVSVASPKRIPTWEELCKIKDMFFEDEEECYQVFPKKSEYVNVHKNCMHIWRDIKPTVRLEKDGVMVVTDIPKPHTVDNTEKNM